MRLKDLTGLRFNRLTVLFRSNDKGRRVRWACKCDCGGVNDVTSESLLSGKVGSCGCLRKESIASVNFSHGMTGTREYKSWSHAKGRCFNTSAPKYPLYGARGITMCDSWRESFEAFFSDMGSAPKGHTLDRINTNGNYEPGNCRWATVKQQGNNTRANLDVTAFGFNGTLKQVAEHFGVSYKMLHSRIAKGMDVEKAIETPPLAAKQVTYQGFTGSLRAVAEHFGCNYGVIHQRINRYGFTLEEAIALSKK